MIDHSLRTALRHSATHRAHLAGAEAAELERQAADARRRYWRELAAVQLLMGHPWPEAEALGVEGNG
jgi:hypothetical protein